MLRMPHSTLLVGVCSLAGVKRRRSLALQQERRVIQRATGALQLGAGSAASEEAPHRPVDSLCTHIADPAAHAACSSVLACSRGPHGMEVTFAACPPIEPAQRLRTETHAPEISAHHEFGLSCDPSAVVVLASDDGPTCAILAQGAQMREGIALLATADCVVANASFVTWVRPPQDASPISECTLAGDSALACESHPRGDERSAPDPDDASCLVALTPEDQLPLDFGDVVINGLRDD